MRLRVISELRHGTEAAPYETGSFVDPDEWLHREGAITFIYGSDGDTVCSDGGIVHKNMIVQHAVHYGLANRDYTSCSQIVKLLNAAQERRQQIEYDRGDATQETHAEKYYNDLLRSIDEFRHDILPTHSLVGRISPKSGGVKYIAFWNDVKLEPLVATCLKDFLHRGLLGFDDIYAQDEKRMTVRNYLRGGRFRPDPEAARQRELRQQLHLMAPDQKKIAMKELGLVGGGHKQPWQKAAEQQKLVSPGQKWWAATSEGRK